MLGKNPYPKLFYFTLPISSFLQRSAQVQLFCSTRLRSYMWLFTTDRWGWWGREHLPSRIWSTIFEQKLHVVGGIAGRSYLPHFSFDDMPAWEFSTSDSRLGNDQWGWFLWKKIGKHNFLAISQQRFRNGFFQIRRGEQGTGGGFCPRLHCVHLNRQLFRSLLPGFLQRHKVERLEASKGVCRQAHTVGFLGTI